MTEGEWVPAQPSAGRIEADSLSLRWWEPGDVAEMLEVVLASREHLRAFLPWATGYSIETAEGYLDRTREGVRTHRDFSYRVEDAATGELLGSAGLMARIGPRALELGYWVRADRTREGIATRAAAALTRAGLELPDVDRVEIHHDAANHASAGVPRRLGYTRAGEYGRAVRAPGQTGRAVRWVTGG
ncbi:MAG TPA: GNAT family N-acetyltransferase [Oryzihumus sp.]|nr:GNAT family N-acetyltransferase [Oryzihumus sp.]